MKHDSQVQADVVAEIQSDASVSSGDLAITVANGVVTLSGTVEAFAERLAARHAAERVAGVKAVVDELNVCLAVEERRSDIELADAVIDALEWNTEVPDNTIKPRIQDRWLWLVGEADWQYQRLAAEHAVENIAGVQGVTNIVRIRRRTPPRDLKEQIERALIRDPVLHPREIGVVVKGTSVILAGIVGSCRERLLAEEAAWSAPGVTCVQNRLELDATH
jgi:osmotically-inducible protein OsmY